MRLPEESHDIETYLTGNQNEASSSRSRICIMPDTTSNSLADTKTDTDGNPHDQERNQNLDPDLGSWLHVLQWTISIAATLSLSSRRLVLLVQGLLAWPDRAIVRDVLGPAGSQDIGLAVRQASFEVRLIDVVRLFTFRLDLVETEGCWRAVVVVEWVAVLTVTSYRGCDGMGRVDVFNCIHEGAIAASLSGWLRTMDSQHWSIDFLLVDLRRRHFPDVMDV
jgi:hypothetical protein